MHQRDSHHIYELNKLPTLQGIFRLAVTDFFDAQIANKDNRFVLLKCDQSPTTIFKYRDGAKAIKRLNRADGLALALSQVLISVDALKKDNLALFSAEK